jgi:hypothetical protein
LHGFPSYMMSPSTSHREPHGSTELHGFEMASNNYAALPMRHACIYSGASK